MSFTAPKQQKGFTIVELLIVIVVIGILAAITIVAYNGFQQRAKNAQTAQALTAWIKALQLYKVDNGAWPNYFTCLGEGYSYGPSGADASGIAQCRQTSAGAGPTENSAFKALMKPYTGGTLPVPAFVTAKNSDTYWYRGLTYLYGGGAGNLVYSEATYAGSVTCPDVAGIKSTSTSAFGGNTYCFYLLGSTTDT